MFLPDNVKRIIELLSESSFKAYAVGGCVRDAIMGKAVSDYDITTSAKPEAVEKILSDNGIKFIETGLKHGTITAVIEHTPYEITTFRTDGKYRDNRHPESVQFVSDIKEDLSRRDFTVNAIAYNDADGFIDLFGGKEDIENRIIRTVGDSNKRFNEDALRIMRALRFSSQLGFEIEENTQKAIFENKELLKNIANERLYSELIKTLMGENCEEVLLKYREVIAVVIPELIPSFDFPQHNKWHLYDVYTHSVKSVAQTPQKDYMRLAMLLHDIGKPHCKTTDENGSDHFYAHANIGAEQARVILKRLRVSNEILNKSVALIENHSDYLSQKKKTIKRRMKILGEDLIFDFIDFQIADLKSHNPTLAENEIKALEEIREITKEIIESNEAYSIKDLDINGFDLMKLGFEGREISEVLEKLLAEVIANPTKNKKEILLSIAERSKSRIHPRLSGYNYNKNGAYFITICTKDKKFSLSSITVGRDALDAPQLKLSEYGKAVETEIIRMNEIYDYINAEKFVIMPNHIHLMLVVSRTDSCGASEASHPTKSVVSTYVGTLKRFVNKRIGENIWQKSFYDHIIRDEDDYMIHIQYIEENPRKWLMGKDEYYF